MRFLVVQIHHGSGRSEQKRSCVERRSLVVGGAPRLAQILVAATALLRGVRWRRRVLLDDLPFGTASSQDLAGPARSCGTGIDDQGAIADGAVLGRKTLGVRMHADAFEDAAAQLVALQQIAKVAGGGLVGRRLAAQVALPARRTTPRGRRIPASPAPRRRT